MKEFVYRIGLDIGSTTAKIAVIDEKDALVYSRYERHHAKVGQLVSSYFKELQKLINDAKVSICVTGSVGMATADQLKADFVQEVVAATTYAKALHPEAKALIDIGGEDAKVVFFNQRSMELRMNGNCAGGTGAFLDQMAILMGVDNDDMNDLAMQAKRIHPMAARCGVFAKTDIQNLMARNIPKTEIAASIFHSIAVQTITSLSHGCNYNPPILLCGGPLTFLPMLRKAFADYLHLEENDFIVSGQSNLIPAMGCALRSSNATLRLSELQDLLDTTETLHWKSDLRPLFISEKEHQSWCEKKMQYDTPIKPLLPEKEQVFIGIDSGSTTIKIIAMRPDCSIAFTYYTQNLGNPIKAVQEGLSELQRQADEHHAELEILGSCSTGYGEELIRTAFNLDYSIIETMAHYQAANRLMPDVSFILDIGGQDMKAIFVENGVVVRMELNEACSSGCGTFLQTFANNLGYDITEFAEMACTATAPCDLGTRCTVFMNSKVKQVMREGASVADISAGLSYSVIKNCLYKVLKLHGNENLGGKIVVQGGTMKNDAVVRAFELLTGQEVARSNIPELMGAYGCAIHAIQQRQSTPSKITDLLTYATYETRQIQCKGCENNCLVSQYSFSEKRKFYSGNKCERIFNNNGSAHQTGKNIYTDKYRMLFGYTEKENLSTSGQRVIGIPRVLNMYEEFPFWHTLLSTCGFKVVLSPPSTYQKYEAALSSVMSDNICFPAKLVHSHITALDCMGLERILMPYVVYERKEDELTDNSFNCPIVSGYSDVVRSSMKLNTPLDAPVINFSNEKLLRKQLNKYLKGLGIKSSVITRATTKALEAQQEFGLALQKRNEEILADSRKHGKITILLAGRPYHTDPLIQHKLSEMIASLGVNVINDDIVRCYVATRGNSPPCQSPAETYLIQQWAYTNRILKAGQWTAYQGDDVHFVQMTSFGCGPDAFIKTKYETS